MAREDAGNGKVPCHPKREMPHLDPPCPRNVRNKESASCSPREQYLHRREAVGAICSWQLLRNVHQPLEISHARDGNHASIPNGEGSTEGTVAILGTEGLCQSYRSGLPASWLGINTTKSCDAVKEVVLRCGHCALPLQMQLPIHEPTWKA